MHSQFQRYNPMRPAAWRQERVLELIEHMPNPRRPSRTRDDRYIREYYRFLLKYMEKTNESERIAMFDTNPALFYAHTLHFHPDKEWRAVAQGFLLTGEPLEHCSAMLDTLPEALDWYERLFFNVRDRLDAEVWVAKTILGSSAYRAANREGSVTESQQDMLFKLFGYYGGPVILKIIISGFRRGSLPRRPEEIAPWFDDTFSMLIKSRATQAARIFQVNKYNVMQLLEIQSSIMNSEHASSQGGPETDVEQNVKAFMERIPWVMAKKGAKDLDGNDIEQHYATTSVEPRADEQMTLALGYAPEPLKLAEAGHDSTRIISVETNEE